MVWDISFMFKRGSFVITNTYLDEFEVRSKVSKNGKFLDYIQLDFPSSNKLQMNFCWTWKLKIFLSHFQKVQDHEHLMNGWGVMAKWLQSVHGTSTSHNFWSKTPNGVTLFVKCLLWHIFSKSIMTLHEIYSYDHLPMHVYFGGKMENLNSIDHTWKVPMPLCSWDDFKWKYTSRWYCSRSNSPCTTHLPILVMHLIFT